MPSLQSLAEQINEQPEQTEKLMDAWLQANERSFPELQHLGLAIEKYHKLATSLKAQDEDPRKEEHYENLLEHLSSALQELKILTNQQEI